MAYNKAINFILNKSIIYNSNKRFTREKLLSTFQSLTKIETENIIEKKEIYYQDYLRETKLNKIIYNVLNKYYKTNRIFLVTNCSKNRAVMILQYYNIEEKFEKIFYKQYDKVKNVNKFKIAISDLNITPQTIIAFENELNEISNAVDAGIPRENIVMID